jgi:HSP20 family protein
MTKEHAMSLPAVAKTDERRSDAKGNGDGQLRQSTRVPAVSVYDTDQAILLIADMPGVSSERIDVVIHQDVLTLKGTVLPDAHEGFRQLSGEYRAASFERSFTLPTEVDSAGVTANVKLGVVTVTLPKRKAVQPRRVTVQTG